MVRYVPEILSGKRYWDLPENQRFRSLVDILYEGFNKKRNREDIEQEILNIRKLAKEDRFEPAAVLLAEASEGFIPEGPRGKRPIIASAYNIYRVCGINRRSQERNMRKLLKESYGGINNLLLYLNLTASNPYSAPKEVEFKSYDIRRGIFIPNEFDDYTVSALGIIYGFGFMENHDENKNKIQITGRQTDFNFFEKIPKIMENSFNILQKQAYEKTQKELKIYIDGRIAKFKETKSPNYTFSSKALATYLINYIGFPRTRKEKRKTGISEKIKKLDLDKKKKFSKSYLASGFFKGSGKIFEITSVSKPMLLDFKDILTNDILGINSGEINIYKNKKAESFQLHIPTRYTEELFEMGLI